jgi:hypothetical protein
MGGLITVIGSLITSGCSACKKRSTEAMGGPILPEQSFMDGHLLPEQTFGPNPSNGRNPEWTPKGTVKRKPRTYSGDLTPWGNPI